MRVARPPAKSFLRNSLPLVADFESDGLRIGVKRDGGRFALGMAMDVGEAFLQDTEKR